MKEGRMDERNGIIRKNRMRSIKIIHHKELEAINAVNGNRSHCRRKDRLWEKGDQDLLHKY